MEISKAISKRILDLCEKQNISINKLAILSCLTQSTLQSIVSCESNNPKLLTIFKICDGLNITIVDFFNDKVFKDINLFF